MASRYWVGGTGTWDNATTAHWSATSGGAGGASVPTAADDVIVDALSGSPTITAGVSNPVCRSLTTTGATCSLVFSGFVLAIGDAGGGGMTLSATTTVTGSISFVSSSTNGGAGWPITTNGRSLGSVTFNGTGSWVFQDAFISTATFTLTQGTLNTNGQTVTSGLFIGTGAATRTLTLGSTTWTVSGAPTAWSVASSGFTLNANTSTLTFNASFQTFVGGGLIYNNVVFIGVSPSISGASTFANLTHTGTAVQTGIFTLIGTPQTVTGTLTVAGNSATNRVIVQSNSLGSARALTVNGSVVSTNADWQDVTAAGTASWNLSASTGGSGDALGNTGITFTTAATQFWVGGTGNWSDVNKWKTTSGGAVAGRVPLPQDTARIDVNSVTTAGQTITLDVPRIGKDINFSGVLNSPAWNQSFGSAGISVYGSYTGGTGMTRSSTGANIIIFSARSAATLTLAGMNLPNTTFAAPGGTYTLQDAYSNGGNGLTQANGTLDANGQNVSTNVYSSNGIFTRVLVMGSGAWTLTGASGATIWNTSTTGMTLTVTGSTLTATGTVGISSITTGGITMPAITFNGAGGTFSLNDSFTTTGTITLTAGTFSTGNQTVTANIFSSNNANVRTITLGSSSVTVTGVSTTSWDITNSGNLTMNANTSTITVSGSASSFTGGGQTYNNVVMTGAGVQLANSTNTYLNLTRTGTATKTDGLLIGSGTHTVTGTFTVTGNSAVNRLFVGSAAAGVAAPGTSRTITAAAVSLTNVDFQDITGAGVAAPFTGTSLGDALGNSGITFTAAVTNYAVAAGNWSSTATWASTSGGVGGTGRVPLPQDNVVLDVNSGAGAYTSDMPRSGKDITCTGFTRTLSGGLIFYGNLILASAMTLSTGTNAWTPSGRSAQTITSAGKSFANTFAIIGSGGTYTLQDTFTTAFTFRVDAGTFVANNQTVTAIFVNFNATSFARAVNMGTGAWTVTGGGSAIVWQTSTTAFTFTISTAVVSFTGTSGTNTIITGGVTMPSLTVNGVGGTFQFSDAFTTAGTITLTAGTLDTNSKSVTSGKFTTSAGSTRALTLGSTAWSVTGSGTSWQVNSGTGMTFTPGTSTITTANGSGGLYNFLGGGLTYNNVVLQSTNGGVAIIDGGNTYANLTYTGAAVKTDVWTLSGNQTVTGTLTATGNFITNRILIQSNTLGTARTITAATVSATNVDFQDITGAGAASWNLSVITGGSGDALGNTGITFTAAQTNYWRGVGSGNWSDATKWSLVSGGGATGRVPLPQDTARFDGNSVGGVTGDMPRAAKDISWSGVNPINVSFSNAVSGSFIYGSLTLASGVAYGGSFLYLMGRSSHTITSNGATWAINTTMNNLGGTYTLQDAFAPGSNVGLNSVSGTAGTLNTNGQTVTTLSMVAGASYTFILGGSAINLTGTTANSGIIWQVLSAATLNAGTSVISITSAYSGSRTFSAGGKTYGTLRYTVVGSTGALLINGGASTFAALDVESEVGNAKTLTLQSAFTTTVTGTLTLLGVSGSPLVINSSTATSAALLSVANTVTKNVDYVSVQDNAASGTGTPIIVPENHITRVSNVSGWGISYARSISDTVGATSTTTRGVSSARTMNEVVAANDFVTRASSTSRSITETHFTITSTVRSSLSASRSISESVNANDSVTSMKFYFVGISEAVSAATTTIRALFANRQVSEVHSTTDSLVRFIIFVRAITENVNANVSVVRRATLARSVNEQVQAADSLSRFLTRPIPVFAGSLNVDLDTDGTTKVILDTDGTTRMVLD